jgi:NADH-quinone oxidoreductase subunit N
LLVGIAVAAAAAVPGTAATGDRSAWLFAAGGISATLFYLSTYSLATIGLFGGIAYLGHRWPEWTSGSGPRPPREEITTVDDLDGLASTNPVAAFALAVFLLSLAGIPPLPGFWGKLSLAVSTLEVDWNSPITPGSRRSWFVGLAVVLVINAAIAAAYYLRIIAAMYFKTTKRGVQADGGLAGGLAMLACLALVAIVTIQPRGLFTAASRAGESIAPQAATPAARVSIPPESIVTTP